MVDISEKLKLILEMVEQGEYFVINRPRQFGKTTTVYILTRLLKEKSGYFPLKLSFEGLGSESFRDAKTFLEVFLLQLKEVFMMEGEEKLEQFIAQTTSLTSMYHLDLFISQMIGLIGKNVVLMVDEVDKSSNNQLFLDFLGMLRNKYLKAIQGGSVTFHSVILVGVHDVKNLKIKLRKEDERKYNSPWNIAADFKVNMDFNTAEIATLLNDYITENEDCLKPDDVESISQRLFHYTSGHPFLVSKMCKVVDEELNIAETNGTWTVSHIDSAFKLLVNEDYTTTNFDEINKNLENDHELYNFVFQLIMDGEKKIFNISNPVIARGALLGILDKSDCAAVHNNIYKQRIYNYMASKIHTSITMDGYNYRDNFLMPDNSLNVEKILLKFQEFMKQQFSQGSEHFLEKDGRLVFLAFIKPIINGKGFDFKEVQTSEEKRLDVVITWMNHKYIIELKKWYGNEYHQKGIEQLSGYLDAESQSKGYLLTFDFRATAKTWKQERINSGNKEIFAVWV